MQWLAEVCVKRPVFATMLILSLVTVGAFSFFSLGVDLFPKIDFPTITITVINPGASPQEIETEVTEKIEEAVNTISGIDELRSTSVEGAAQIFVQFVLEKDVNVAAQEVENRVQTVIPNLPETAEQPTVQKLDTDAAPVLRIVVSAPTSLRDVTEFAKNKIKERIESINGVGQVTIIGGRERQINVWVDPDKMRSYSITPAEVSDRFANSKYRISERQIRSGRDRIERPNAWKNSKTRRICQRRRRHARHIIRSKSKTSAMSKTAPKNCAPKPDTTVSPP